MENSCPNLRAKVFIGEAERHVSVVEHGDLIRSHRVVINATFGERDSFVQAEQDLTVRVLCLAGAPLHDEDHIVDPSDDPRGQGRQNGVHFGLEFVNVHAVRLGPPAEPDDTDTTPDVDTGHR